MKVAAFLLLLFIPVQGHPPIEFQCIQGVCYISESELERLQASWERARKMLLTCKAVQI